MNLLITGGNGFIAKNLSEQLRETYSVTTCNSKELNLLDAPLVYEFIKNHRFDVIIHTATYDPAPKYSTKDPLKVLENNLKMFFNVARCKNHFGKMLYFGSGAEFDREYWMPLMKESYYDQYVPSDQYGFSKYVMTKYAENSDKIYNLRVFSVFGKYEDWRYRFISKACCCAILNLPVICNQNVYFDYMYIDDFVKIVKWFIENNPHRHIYNLCTSKIYEYQGLAGIISGFANNKLEVIFKNEGWRKEYSGDNTQLLEELKGFKFETINESILKLYNWYELNRHIIDKKELMQG